MSSQVDDTPTATSAATQDTLSFAYVKNNVDLSEEVLEFKNNELYYYDFIKSYTSEEKVALFICVSGLVAAGAYYDLSGNVTEYFRNNVSVESSFESIQEWYNNYYGEPVSVYKVLDNVFIGEDLVPLWKVLEDSNETDEVNEDESQDDTDNEIVNNVTNIIIVNDNVSKWFVLFVTYLTVTTITVSVCGVILLSILT